MLTDAQVEQFKADGYVCGGRVVDDDHLEQLRSDLERVIRDHGKADVRQPVSLRNLSGDDDAPVWQIVNIYEASDAFRRLIDLSTITEEIAQLTGADELRIWHDQVQYKPAEKGGVNMWHQDGPLWRILEPKSQVSAWIALDDVDEANGCMSMVPCSHRWGNQIQYLHKLKSLDSMTQDHQGRSVQPRLCPVAKGCVHYHDALTWHGSHANSSGRPRRAIAIHYMTDQTRYKASGDHLMQKFVTVPDGEKLEGDRFPLVWQARA